MDSASANPWPDLRVGVEGFEDAWLQIYSALQWLARIENSFIGQGLDPKNFSLRWSPADCAVRTGEFEKDGIALELRIPEFVLQFIENGSPTRYAFRPDDKSPAEIEAWILVELLHRKIDRSRFSKKLPYGVSHLMTGDAPRFRTEGREQEFQDVANWLRAANEVLRSAGEQARLRGWEICRPVQLRPSDFVIFTRIEGRESSRGPIEIGFGTRGSTKQPQFYLCPASDALETSSADLVELPIGQLAEDGLDQDGVLAALDLKGRLNESGG